MKSMRSLIPLMSAGVQLGESRLYLTLHTDHCGHAMTTCMHFFNRAGMSKVSALEEEVHGRQRALEDEDELRFGVTEEMLYARAAPPVDGAQWTGLVTRIAIAMLDSGAVDAVVCVQSDENDRCAALGGHSWRRVCGSDRPARSSISEMVGSPARRARRTSACRNYAMIRHGK